MEITKRIVAASLIFCAGSAFAENTWYAGIELGNIDNAFYPEYTTTFDNDISAFKNTADGVEAGLLAGISMPVAQRFSMAVQARVARTDSEWTLYLPDEPADFSYKIPTSVALSLVPAIQLHDRIRLFGELGFVGGRIQERKSSPSANHSSYDFNDWVDGYLWGVGVSLSLNPQWSLQAVYRDTDYSSLEYKTYLPDGTHFETVVDNPESESVSLGVIYSFN